VRDHAGGESVIKSSRKSVISVLLFYMKNKKRYGKLRVCLQEHILQKFREIRKEKRGDSTELVLLLFDALACPNLSDAFKTKLLSLNGVSDKGLQRGIIEREGNWFTRWKDFDFGRELDAKRSLEVY